jgi:hypothetical protein
VVVPPLQRVVFISAFSIKVIRSIVPFLNGNSPDRALEGVPSGTIRVPCIFI